MVHKSKSIASVEIPIRRKRGRPRKHPLPEPTPEPPSNRASSNGASGSRLPLSVKAPKSTAKGEVGPASVQSPSPPPPQLVLPPTILEVDESPVKLPKKRGRKPKSYYEELARQAQLLADRESATQISHGSSIIPFSKSRPIDVPSSSSLKTSAVGTGSSKAPYSSAPTTPPASVRRSLRHRQSDMSCGPTALEVTCSVPTVPNTVAAESRGDLLSNQQLTFQSCLTDVHFNAFSNEMRPWHSYDEVLGTSSGSLQEPSPRSLPVVVLKRALSIQELGDESWLSSSFMDLVITQFAKTYPCARYFSVDFARLHANDNMKDEVTDILGRPWKTDFNFASPESSLIFFVNAQNIHWTLIRVVLVPQPELQFFEPMGMPSRNRHTGLNYRTGM